MKHFDDIRKDVLDELIKLDGDSDIDQVCVLFDLKGKCRILAKVRGPDSGDQKSVNEDELRTRIESQFKPLADVFWGDEVWVHSKTTPPSRKAIFDVVWNEARSLEGSKKCSVLDRHLSKDAWFGAPIVAPWLIEKDGRPIQQNPPIISFFSFKGGVGRTTSLAALAVNLARDGKRVVVIDFDLEAPGAGTLFKPKNGAEAQFGIVDFLLEYPLCRKQRLEIADYCTVCDDPDVIRGGEAIVSVAAGHVDERYIEKLARINYEFLYRSATEPDAPDAEGQSPIRGLLSLLNNRWEPDCILIDSRAGLHDLGGLSLSGVAHRHVLFGLDSDQSWQGISLAVAHLGRQELLAGRKQRDCTLVQAMSLPQAREQTTARFRNRAYDVFCDQYYEASDSDDSIWPVPDFEDPEQPHSPFVLSWDNRVFGFQSLAEIADILCEGEYRRLAESIMEKLGRPLT